MAAEPRSDIASKSPTSCGTSTTAAPPTSRSGFRAGSPRSAQGAGQARPPRQRDANRRARAAHADL